MPVSFEFDRRPTTPQRRSSKGRYLRFFVLLCIVAVITYAIVRAVVPGKGKATPAENPGTQESSAGKGADVEKVITDNGAAGESGEYVKPTAVKDAEAAAKEQRRSSSDKPDNKKNPKGVAAPSDLPPEKDKPVFRKNALPDVSAQVDAIKNIAADGAMAILTELLDKEAGRGGTFSMNWLRAGEALGKGRVARFNSGAWKSKAKALNYRVKSGDALVRIAYRNQTTVEFIKKSNGLKSDAIRIGQQLKLLPGPWKIEISRSARILNVWRKQDNNWRIFAVFPVGVGRDNKTPLGTFYISGRLYHPVYSGAEGRKYVYGSPENPLGDCFLKLGRIQGKRRFAVKYGIHGSNDDNSVGRSFSNGCVRMRNRDIKFLYYLLPVRTPVEIVD